MRSYSVSVNVGAISFGIALALITIVSSAQTGASGALRGRALDLSRGAPIEGGTVSLMLEMDGSVPIQRPNIAQYTTDAQGAFSFRDLKPGIYRLFAERAGFARPSYDSAGSYSIVIGAGQLIANAELRLAPLGRALIKVTDSSGRPVADATVRFLNNGFLNGQRWLTAARILRTNSAGECSGELEPGDYVFEAKPPKMGTAPQGRTVDALTYYPNAPEPGIASVHVAPGQVFSAEIRFRRVPAFRIRGRVVDPERQTGTTFLYLAARNAANNFDLLSESVLAGDGTFQINGVSPGSYYLGASRRVIRQPDSMVVVRAGSDPPLAVAGTAIELTDRDMEGVVLEMKPLSPIRGSVTQEEGVDCRFTSGIDTITLLLLAPAIPGIASVEPARIGLGAFSLQNVPLIRNRLTVSYIGDCYVKSMRYQGREIDDRVADFSQEGDLEIAFARGGGISGIVVNGVGTAVSRATVQLVPDGREAESAIRAVLRANGTFTFRGVPPGAYKLLAWEVNFGIPPRNAMLETLLKAFAGRGISVSLKAGVAVEGVRLPVIAESEIARVAALPSIAPPVKQRGGIAGAVADATTGAPVKGARVTVTGWREATRQAVSETGIDGTFEIGNLEPGFYHVAAARDGYDEAKYGNGASPYGSIVVGEGQWVTGISLAMRARR
jgi:hypothetical protein